MLDLSTWTDISAFQNKRYADDPLKPINFQQMQDQGVEGVVIRKCIGKSHDPAFEMNWDGAGRVDELKRSVYCVPYMAYDMGPQIEVMGTWPSGGGFDGECDIPAWDDVEHKHNLTRAQAISRLMPYHLAMRDTFGGVEFYTAKYVFEDFYSSKVGWHNDWGLVVASYRPDLYHLTVGQIRGMVARLEIHPTVPRGWLYNVTGDAIPSHLRWEQWQIMADKDGLGTQYGVHSRDIDISFRQGKVPGDPPPGDQLAQLRLAFGELSREHDSQSIRMREFQELLNA